MDEDRSRGIFLSGPAHDLEEMLLVGVDPLVLEQAEEMEAALALLPVPRQIFPDLSCEEFAGAQPVVDPFEFLDDDPAGPHVEMAHLRRPLIPLRKPHRLAGALQKGPGILRLEPVTVGRFGRQNGISLGVFAVPPSVTNDQAHRSHGFLPP
jgi:hypothetical protein